MDPWYETHMPGEEPVQARVAKNATRLLFVPDPETKKRPPVAHVVRDVASATPLTKFGVRGLIGKHATRYCQLVHVYHLARHLGVEIRALTGDLPPEPGEAPEPPGQWPEGMLPYNAFDRFVRMRLKVARLATKDPSTKRPLGTHVAAERAGVDQTYVWRMENGEIQHLDLIRIERLCHVYGVPLDEVLTAETADST